MQSVSLLFIVLVACCLWATIDIAKAEIKGLSPMPPAPPPPSPNPSPYPSAYRSPRRHHHHQHASNQAPNWTPSPVSSEDRFEPFFIYEDDDTIPTMTHLQNDTVLSGTVTDKKQVIYYTFNSTFGNQVVFNLNLTSLSGSIFKQPFKKIGGKPRLVLEFRRKINPTAYKYEGECAVDLNLPRLLLPSVNSSSILNRCSINKKRYHSNYEERPQMFYAAVYFDPLYEDVKATFTIKAFSRYRCINGCNKHGDCDYTTGLCTCRDPGYVGVACLDKGVKEVEMDKPNTVFNITSSAMGIFKVNSGINTQLDVYLLPNRNKRVTSQNVLIQANDMFEGYKSTFTGPHHYTLNHKTKIAKYSYPVERNTDYYIGILLKSLAGFETDTLQATITPELHETCWNDCNGNGYCENGVCQCNIGWDSTFDCSTHLLAIPVGEKFHKSVPVSSTKHSKSHYENYLFTVDRGSSVSITITAVNINSMSVQAVDNSFGERVSFQDKGILRFITPEAYYGNYTLSLNAADGTSFTLFIEIEDGCATDCEGRGKCVIDRDSKTQKVIGQHCECEADYAPARSYHIRSYTYSSCNERTTLLEPNKVITGQLKAAARISYTTADLYYTFMQQYADSILYIKLELDEPADVNLYTSKLENYCYAYTSTSVSSDSKVHELTIEGCQIGKFSLRITATNDANFKLTFVERRCGTFTTCSECVDEHRICGWCQTGSFGTNGTCHERSYNSKCYKFRWSLATCSAVNLNVPGNPIPEISATPATASEVTAKTLTHVPVSVTPASTTKSPTHVVVVGHKSDSSFGWLEDLGWPLFFLLLGILVATVLGFVIRELIKRKSSSSPYEQASANFEL